MAPPALSSRRRRPEDGTVCQGTATSGDTLSHAVAQPSLDALTAAETGIGNDGTATAHFGDDVRA